MLLGWTLGHNTITLYMLSRVMGDVHRATSDEFRRSFGYGRNWPPTYGATFGYGRKWKNEFRSVSKHIRCNSCNYCITHNTETFASDAAQLELLRTDGAVPRHKTTDDEV